MEDEGESLDDWRCEGRGKGVMGGGIKNFKFKLLTFKNNYLKTLLLYEDDGSFE